MYPWFSYLYNKFKLSSNAMHSVKYREPATNGCRTILLGQRYQRYVDLRGNGQRYQRYVDLRGNVSMFYNIINL